MSRKSSKRDEGIASYNAWVKECKKFEKMGMHGADYFIKRVEVLEAKIKKLQAKLKKKGNK